MTTQKDIPAQRNVVEAETEVSSKGSLVPAAAIVLGNMIIFWGGIIYLVLR